MFAYEGNEKLRQGRSCAPKRYKGMNDELIHTTMWVVPPFKSIFILKDMHFRVVVAIILFGPNNSA
jgi:hypothetical protein